MDNGKNKEGIHAQKKLLAAERGKRLRICRNYTGLNIKEFCEKYGFNIITFGRWEKGNKISINEKNVGKICHALHKEGIICTPTWLLEGTGTDPLKKDDQPLFAGGVLSKAPQAIATVLIFSEIEFFQNNHENAIITIMDDPAMEPFYHVNDHVGGVKLISSEYELAHKKICLVKISGANKIFLRVVQLSGKTIILTATNPNPSYSYSEPIILDDHANLEFIAPVVFHLKSAEWIQRKV